MRITIEISDGGLIIDTVSAVLYTMEQMEESYQEYGGRFGDVEIGYTDGSSFTIETS